MAIAFIISTTKREFKAITPPINIARKNALPYINFKTSS
jgi:hypothetical protein